MDRPYFDFCLSYFHYPYLVCQIEMGVLLLALSFPMELYQLVFYSTLSLGHYYDLTLLKSLSVSVVLGAVAVEFAFSVFSLFLKGLDIDWLQL